ncbi:MAG: DUF6838 family protein [Vulcanibacillus sp.]
MSITINDIRDGVIYTIKQQFPTMKIYGEEVKQGFREPCFFIKVLQLDHAKEINRHYIRTHSFDVHYFGLSNEDMHNVADNLYNILEYISITGGLCRGVRMKHEIVDRALHFFVDYKIRLIKETEDNPKLKELEVNEYGK